MRISDKLAGVPAYNPGDSRCAVVLNANESFLSPDGPLQEELMRALLETALNRYPDPLAEEACQAFAAYYGLPRPGIVCGAGSDELISLLYSCLVKAGDRVLTLQPDFSMYNHYAMMNDVVDLRWQKATGHRIDVDEVLAAAQEQDVAMILFSNPCNPTGVGLTRTEVLRLVDGFDGLVVVDEAYMDFWDQSVADEVARRNNLIVLKTCSKAIALAALRVGFAIMPEPLAALVIAGKSPYNVSSVSQVLATTVLKHGDVLDRNTARIKASMAQLAEGLDALLVGVTDVLRYPSQGNFIYLESPRAGAIADRLAAEGVLVRAFKTPQALRVCCGTEEENAAFLKAFAVALQEVHI